ncbi:family 20 glycosylhydrolase [Streptomyces sp. NBC_01142]|uniref:beta-N-acetylhexosaminidase n=1 Tax=Streptomyces sp. NBC_01142 TaxID=2975865 RepID=UPI002252FF9F|nr:glycoside hydrolase family 20 protein [Streptomyces sp. NBC_01142]MCX4818898.1 family 20 glycosylhydrolase [Streptomyces sp. NBC_01142]
MWHSRSAQVTGMIVSATVAFSLTLAGCSAGDSPAAAGGGVQENAKTPTPPPAPSSPSPSRVYPLSRAPATIPFVRTHEAARGPGWIPGRDSAVVVPKGSEALADEGRLIARELKLGYRGAVPARAGDVELALASTRQGEPESYTVTTRDRRVRISGGDEAGVFYGTRTLKQAVRSGGAMPEGVVRDEPDRPQRGLMLDIARKHFTAGWIEDRLREMADLKLNQLGLHFSDDQGFRIASDSHPEVVSRQHLTKDEVRRIVALAGRLHIAVVPEIDSPGHLGAVIAAHPQLQLRNAAGAPTRGAIDIAQPESARIVDDLLREYADLFTDPRIPQAYWHLGGDEYQALVVQNPEASYPALAAAARQKYGPRARVQDLATGWVNDRAAVVRPQGKKLKAWNDGFFRGGVVAADKDLEVEYWTGKEFGARQPEEYLREGRKLVNVNDEYLYYVLGEPNEFRYPTGRRIYQEWTPLVVRGSKPVAERYSELILGGRFAVWCDLANSQTQDQIARGIRLPLRATSQKLWDPRTPARDWQSFVELSRTLG